MYERNYKVTKSFVKATRYVIELIAKLEFARNITAMVCYHLEIHYYQVSKTTECTFTLEIPNLLSLFKYSLIDDFIQSLDTNKLWMTYSERLQISEQACEKWMEGNKRWLEFVDDMTWDQNYYSSLTWAHKNYTSLSPPSSTSNANQWIIDNQKNLGWVYYSDETITYYIIRAYAVCVSMNNQTTL